mmetsp:Transcript_56243/g.136343  ORF Transcript_56243/g.136343 Transcript_56243/m.136343 type:complete len:85 (-) Transcript_56243:119-373(-)
MTSSEAVVDTVKRQRKQQHDPNSRIIDIIVLLVIVLEMEIKFEKKYRQERKCERKVESNGLWYDWVIVPSSFNKMGVPKTTEDS